MQFYIKKSLLETHTELEDLVGWEKFSVTVLFVLELRCVKKRIKILDFPSTVSAILISRETVWKDAIFWLQKSTFWGKNVQNFS